MQIIFLKNITIFILKPFNLTSSLLPSRLILRRATTTRIILGHTSYVGRLPIPYGSGARLGSWGIKPSTAHLEPSSAISEVRIRPSLLSHPPQNIVRPPDGIDLPPRNLVHRMPPHFPYSTPLHSHGSLEARD